MQPEPGTIFLALALFALKHFVADFVLQTRWMMTEKGHYGRLGGIAHATVHMGSSVPALVVLGAGPLAASILILFEGAVHYHLDFLKESISRRLAMDPSHKGFWILLGADQLLHQLTYILIVFLFIRHGI